jgi:hypothetical protein
MVSSGVSITSGTTRSVAEMIDPSTEAKIKGFVTVDRKALRIEAPRYFANSSRMSITGKNTTRCSSKTGAKYARSPKTKSDTGSPKLFAFRYELALNPIVVSANVRRKKSLEIRMNSKAVDALAMKIMSSTGENRMSLLAWESIENKRAGLNT